MTRTNIDHEAINKVVTLLRELIRLNPEYNTNHWAAGYMGLIAIAFRNKYSYEEFQDGIEEMVKHYKHLWEE